MTKLRLPPLFAELAQERFRFLEAAGLDKPKVVIKRDDAKLEYESDDFTVSVSVLPWDGVQASVVPRRPEFPPRLSSGLDCLYQAAGLGSVNWINNAATSQHSLKKAIESNANALEELLPILKGPRFAELVAQCFGREQTPRDKEPPRGPGLAGA